MSCGTDFGGIYFGKHILLQGGQCWPMPFWISNRSLAPTTEVDRATKAHLLAGKAHMSLRLLHTPESRPGKQRAQNLTPTTCGLALALRHTLMAPASTGMGTWPHPPSGDISLQDPQGSMVRNPGIQPSLTSRLASSLDRASTICAWGLALNHLGPLIQLPWIQPHPPMGQQ